MTVLSDKWIRKMSKEQEMISPFEEKQVRGNSISYGLSSFGYDARVSDEFKIFTNVNSEIVDPKNFKPTNFVTKNTSECIIPPNSFVLARTVEKFKIPDDVLVICLGKSTYARCGIIVNVTPLEPGWEGYVTLEFSNTTPLPAKIYANEGVAQFIFLKGNEKPEVTYADRDGKYMGPNWGNITQSIVMQKLEVFGANKLKGQIKISGSKNASLPILAATLLSRKKVYLKNLPRVRDIETMASLLQSLGSNINFNKNNLTIDNKQQNKNFASYSLVKTMRAGILVLGPLLAKFGKAKVSLPGGCAIGT
jgi:dCTP deaminase